MTNLTEFTKAKFVTVLDEITRELKGVDAKIKQLNGSAGKFTPADQKLVDDLAAQSRDLVERLEELRKDATAGQLNVAPAPIPGPDGKLPPGSLDVNNPRIPVPPTAPPAAKSPAPSAKTVITPVAHQAAAAKK